jgi:hypothetical protein
MITPTTRPPRKAQGQARRFGSTGATGCSCSAKHHSRPKPEQQGRAKRPQLVRGGIASGSRQRPNKSLSVTDGQVFIGTVQRFADPRNGARWLATNAEGRVVGAYSTMDAAMAALPAPKVQP